jgi:hypothetical protein
MKELASDNWGVAGETVAERRQREKIRGIVPISGEMRT